MKKRKKTYQKTYQRGNIALMRRIHNNRANDDQVPTAAYMHALPCLVMLLCCCVLDVAGARFTRPVLNRVLAKLAARE